MIVTSMTPLASLSLVLALAPQGDAPNSTPPIAWQRSLADALAVQKRTGLPLLIAVNMNGEVFNDRFRTSTYLTDDFIESTRGYVCVIASPDRHNTRDYDSLGNRIECPAFLGCTCGEHIAIEPLLFAKYFGGNRNAPRHVGVSPDGKVLFDRFLDRSMQTAIDEIAKHRGQPVDATPPSAVGDLLERRDAASRRALEGIYRRTRDAAILGAAGDAESEPFDVLRLALHSESPDEFEGGVDALSKTATPAALPDLENALARDPLTRGIVLGTIKRLAETDERAARLRAHLTGNDETIGSAWITDWQEPTYEIWQRKAVEAELDACEKQLGTKPNDHETRLRFAIAQLAFAKILIATNGKGIEFWLEDARNSAQRIRDEELQPEAWGVFAVATFLKGDIEEANKAVAKALPGQRGDRRPNAWVATQFFETLVQLDTRAAYARATDPKAILQPEVARVRKALDLLTRNRWFTEETVLTGIGLLEYAGLRTEARDLLSQVVRRFQSSAAVHERWRARTTADFGAEQMRLVAGTLATEAADKATGQWFAGYAGLVAAEQHVRDWRDELSVTAYTDSIDRFARSVELNPDFAASANHFAVLALAGRAQAHRDLADAVPDLVRAAALRPASLDSQDGLQRTPRGIADAIQKALEAAGQAELAARLEGIAR